MGHARALIPLENPDQQVFMARLIIEKNLSVRQVEKMMTDKRRPAIAKPRKEMDPDLLALQDEMVKILGTKVAISGNTEQGTIKLYYFSLEDLNRIFEKIKGVTV